MTKTFPKTNLRRIRAIRRGLGRNDAETLARLFTDHRIIDDGTLIGCVCAILEATEHRWFPQILMFMDVPGLYELCGASDRGFRSAFRDPWACGRDQIGHFLTAMAVDALGDGPVADLMAADRELSRIEIGVG